MKVIITLSTGEVRDLQKPLHGTGGFQSLIASLRKKLHGYDLELNLRDVERIARYVENYGEGGFQGRLGGVLTEIRNLVNALRAMI